MVINGVSRATLARARAARGGFGRFQVGEAPMEAEAAPAAAAPVALTSLLAMQEAESSALQDRDARRHGAAVIDELAELQRALLGGAGPDLGRLTGLAERPVAATDPGLASVLRSIQLRAGIELARHRAAASR
jgi:hypothetical protein